jgi:hypothetical protein
MSVGQNHILNLVQNFMLTQIEHPGDPERCQGIDQTGQCQYKKNKGIDYCDRHQGASAVNLRKVEVKNYRLAKFQARMQELADSGGVKNLREEIGLLRMLIEERVNICNNPMDLLLHSSVISDLVMKVEKVVTSCNKLEHSLGNYLDKTQVIILASKIMDLIADHIEPEKLEFIGQSILKLVETMNESEANISRSDS